MIADYLLCIQFSLHFCCIIQCAGGLPSGLGITECTIKECQEEGSVDDETLKKLKPIGSIR